VLVLPQRRQEECRIWSTFGNTLAAHHEDTREEQKALRIASGLSWLPWRVRVVSLAYQVGTAGAQS